MCFLPAEPPTLNLEGWEMSSAISVRRDGAGTQGNPLKGQGYSAGEGAENFLFSQEKK